MSTSYSDLPYNPEELPRELKRHYISATDQEIQEMMDEIGIANFEELFAHIPEEVRFKSAPEMCEELSYPDLVKHVQDVAAKNNTKLSFIGDGLKNYRVPEIVPYVCNIRGLTTAYTPYQPERSQGTLQTLWIYASSLSMLTGYEAINASFYERSTCLYESLNTALRLVRGSTTALIPEAIYPGDLEVLHTLAKETKLKIKTISINSETGTIDLEKLKEVAKSLGSDLACIAFPQVNCFGSLEDVHALTDLCTEIKVQSIALFDPILLATDGLIPPSNYGSEQQGANMIVGEGQHLAIGPNFGGPGLGIFGIRYNSETKNAIRSTAGRYIGKAKDTAGNDALSIVLATREQHIRREKATSNICSNQSFLASAAGAAILERGEEGMTKAAHAGRDHAQSMAKRLTSFKGVNLAFPKTPFYNEFTLDLPISSSELIEKATQDGIHLGVDCTERIDGDRSLLQVSFFDIHRASDLDKLEEFFASQFEKVNSTIELPNIPSNYLRTEPVGLPSLSSQQLKSFYDELGQQNVSPDDNIYPLGSCTMKYNPYINDYAAGLPGLTDIHPQAPLEDAQGALHILYETQEIFKRMTGLPGVTTQPVAGAQGELVGLKMFQAYHNDKGEGESRNIILIPKSAHGTNPATASMAGFETKLVNGSQYGIVPVNANSKGQIDFSLLSALVEKYGNRIAGIMVTNPNTSGIFEQQFKEIADLIHSVGGLVYMDGANMNAIAGWIDLGKMGVDAVHNNLHKTWTIPHGGGGPGDAIVAVSQALVDFMPGIQVQKDNDIYRTFVPSKSIGSIHRHFGNFAHKTRCYTYLMALGTEGIRRMSAVAVLSAKYLYKKLKDTYPSLPAGADAVPRMHEFILTISPETFARIEKSGTPKAQAVAKIGKLFLDFGLHAPTVAFPEIYGLMVEPTESFSKVELDRFVEVVKAIHQIINETPEVLKTVPHFTPVYKVDEVGANKNLILSERLEGLPVVRKNKVEPGKLCDMEIGEICQLILKAHEQALA
jgi:glycine dehydrogenase